MEDENHITYDYSNKRGRDNNQANRILSTLTLEYLINSVV